MIPSIPKSLIPNLKQNETVPHCLSVSNYLDEETKNAESYVARENGREIPIELLSMPGPSPHATTSLGQDHDHNHSKEHSQSIFIDLGAKEEKRDDYESIETICARFTVKKIKEKLEDYGVTPKGSKKNELATQLFQCMLNPSNF